MSKNIIKYSLILPAVVFFCACGAKVVENDKVTVAEKVVEKNVSEEVKKVEETKDVKVKIKTSMGDIVIVLYGETPLHQKNFIKLVNEKFYDGILFHRVIKDFMIQAGDPDSKTATKGQMLGTGGPGYTINAEFNSKFLHKKGALSAARQGDDVNPQKKSSGSQFYIVQGKKYNEQEMQQVEAQMEAQTFMPMIRQYLQQNPEEMKKVQDAQAAGDQVGFQKVIDSITEKLKNANPHIEVYKFSEEQKKVYKTVGGAPHLDGGYTVFGEVVEGLDIVDKIAAVATGGADRPIEDVKIISMELLD